MALDNEHKGKEKEISGPRATRFPLLLFFLTIREDPCLTFGLFEVSCPDPTSRPGHETETLKDWWLRRIHSSAGPGVRFITSQRPPAW